MEKMHKGMTDPIRTMAICEGFDHIYSWIGYGVLDSIPFLTGSDPECWIRSHFWLDRIRDVETRSPWHRSDMLFWDSNPHYTNPILFGSVAASFANNGWRMSWRSRYW